MQITKDSPEKDLIGFLNKQKFFATKSEAMKREKEIKAGKSRQKIQLLLSGE